MKLSIKRSITAEGKVKCTKTGNSRFIELSLRQKQTLEDYLANTNNKGYLFPNTHNHSNWVYRVWRKVLQGADIKEDFRPYRMRLTAITAAVQRDPRRIALIAKEFGNSPDIIFKHYLGFIEPFNETNPTT